MRNNLGLFLAKRAHLSPKLEALIEVERGRRLAEGSRVKAGQTMVNAQNLYDRCLKIISATVELAAE